MYSLLLCFCFYFSVLYIGIKPTFNNHVNINLEYHTVEDPETNLEEYHIVKFTIEPLSIGHVFKPNEDLTWTSRWDLYLALNDAETSGEVDHWMTISNSLAIVVFVTSAITLILFRSLR